MGTWVLHYVRRGLGCPGKGRAKLDVLPVVYDILRSSLRWCLGDGAAQQYRALQICDGRTGWRAEEGGGRGTAYRSRTAAGSKHESKHISRETMTCTHIYIDRPIYILRSTIVLH